MRTPLRRAARALALVLLATALGWQPARAATAPELIFDQPGCSVGLLKPFKGQLYFVSSCVTTSTGFQHLTLYRSDGTAAGTTQVKDWWKVLGIDLPYGFVQSDTAIFFWRATATAYELWSSDGTTAGTGRIKDFPVGSQFSTFMQVIGPRLYMVGGGYDWATGEGGVQIWTSDGTASGTVLLRNIPVPNPPDVTHDNFVFGESALDGTFIVQIPRSTQLGVPYDLWRSGGTPETTVKVTGLDALPEPANYRLSYGGRVYYVRSFAGTEGMWQTDGTAAGTGPVPFQPWPQEWAYPATWTTTDSYMYYGSAGTLWRTNGTAACTIPLPLAEGLTPSGGVGGARRLLFWAHDSASGQYALWGTDGTPGGTAAISAIPSVAGEQQTTGVARIVGDRFLAVATPAGGSGYSVWLTDGTNAGTTLLQSDFGQGLAGGPAVLGGDAYFVGWNSSGASLWRIPGAAQAPASAPQPLVAPGGQSFLPLVANPC